MNRRVINSKGLRHRSGGGGTREFLRVVAIGGGGAGAGRHVFERREDFLRKSRYSGQIEGVNLMQTIKWT